MRMLTVTLPDDMRDIEERVAVGDHASESEVVRDGLEALTDSGFELDQDDIAAIRASYDEMKADPSLGVPIDGIMDRIRKRVLGGD